MEWRWGHYKLVSGSGFIRTKILDIAFCSGALFWWCLQTMLKPKSILQWDNFAPTFGCPNVGPPFCSRFAFLSFVSTCWTYIFVAERILPKFSPRSNRSNLNLYRMLHLLNGLLTGAYRVRVHKQYFEKNLRIPRHSNCSLLEACDVKAVASPQRTRPQSVPVNVSKDFKGLRVD